MGVDDDVLVMGLTSLILDVVGTSLDGGDFDFDVGTDIEMKGNASDDVLALSGSSVDPDLRIDTRTGDDVIGVGAVLLSVGRNLDVKTGLANDLISAESIEFERSTLLVLGSRNDAVAVTGIATGNAAKSKLSVNLGSGIDELAVGN